MILRNPGVRDELDCKLVSTCREEFHVSHSSGNLGSAPHWPRRVWHHYRESGKDIAALVPALFTTAFRKDYFAGRGRKLRKGSPMATGVEALVFLKTSIACSIYNRMAGLELRALTTMDTWKHVR